jgi:hypothetical protein
MPGRKLTMLPDAVVAAFTLQAGATPPALRFISSSTTPARFDARRQKSSGSRSPQICA